MLTHLHIRDFTLVEQKDVTFKPGLTALTGETGAGKSILLEALGLALGDRADADRVRAGAERTEVSAAFDVGRLAAVRKYLAEQELGDEECLLRRVVTLEGRSRAFINGRPVTLAQLRSLGDLLVDMHSQHEHQFLLKPATHRHLLDDFGQHTAQADALAKIYQQWRALRDQGDEVRQQSEALNARFQLLSYQVEELDQLGLAPGELEQLETKQQQLANAEEIMRCSEQVKDICCESEDSIEVRLNRALTLLQNLPGRSARLSEVETMLQSALIQVEEAGHELARAADGDNDDAHELPEIENRLTAVYDLARKHRVAPEALLELHQQLAEELRGLQSGDEQLQGIEQAMAEAEVSYRAAAAKLSQLRSKAAKALARAVNQQLSKLAMARAQFEVSLHANAEPARAGAEQVEFLISTVPGQPPKPLAKIASGGELSRISLAIVVVTAKTSVTPTLVFDEVDVGIGGTTGDVVGQMLRELGESAQVMCVTHLAQVASKAHNHLKVEKSVSKNSASTAIVDLTGEDKVLEIARMMGGESHQSVAHARAMLGVTA